MFLKQNSGLTANVGILGDEKGIMRCWFDIRIMNYVSQITFKTSSLSIVYFVIVFRIYELTLVGRVCPTVQ
jgi:hypothetical protein